MAFFGLISETFLLFYMIKILDKTQWYFYWVFCLIEY